MNGMNYIIWHLNKLDVLSIYELHIIDSLIKHYKLAILNSLKIIINQINLRSTRKISWLMIYPLFSIMTNIFYG